MTTLTLDEIKHEVQRLAHLIDAGDGLLPTFGYSEDFARPHIEVDARGYHYVVVERGQEQQRITTPDLDELLYVIFESIAFGIAGSYELKHRIEAQDNRRLHFQKQRELMQRLSPRWAERKAREQDDLLRKFPFDDASDARVRLTVQLREGDHTPEEAWRLACERLPLPPGSQW